MVGAGACLHVTCWSVCRLPRQRPRQRRAKAWKRASAAWPHARLKPDTYFHDVYHEP